ncbi:MAG: sensor histidine kinase, partial [Eggerthellaceae bacterium]
MASLSGEATPSIRSSLEKINMSAQFLLSLVNDILDMSKIENDKMRIDGTARLRSLAERLQSMFFLQAEDKGVLFETRCDADDVVVGDDVRLQQVLANLLSNALKFTDPGDAIRLSVVVLMRDEGSARVRFSVEDTGAGIREEDLERIFVSFEQASENRRNAQGTGLGLAISSNLVRLMGGRLDVQSRVGEGSEFFFVLELPTAD